MEHLNQSGGLTQMLAVLAALESRRGRGGGGRRRRWPFRGSGASQFDDVDEDVWDEYDDVVGASDASEMDYLLSEEDEDTDTDESTVEGVGATLATLENKLIQVEAKIKDKQSEYNALPLSRRRRRRRLANDIQRLSRKRDKLRAKIRRKRGKYERRYERKHGKAPPPAPPPGVVPPGTGTPHGYTFRPGAPPVLGMYPMVSVERQPGTGLRVPFRDNITGSKYTRITVTAGAGLRTAPIAMTTAGIAFGKYRVRAIEYELQAVKRTISGTDAEGELLVNVDFTQVQVSGNIDLLLQDADGTQAAQRTSGSTTLQRTMTGVRQDSVLDKTNTAVLSAVFRQEVTTTGSDIEAVFKCAVIVDSIDDSAAQHGM